MLGYNEDDIYKMQACISVASQFPNIPPAIVEGMEMALSFFDGLWAEGYFD